MLLFIVFVDFAEAFNTVSRLGQYKVLENIDCPHLLKLITSDMKKNMQDKKKTKNWTITQIMPITYWLKQQSEKLLSRFVLGNFQKQLTTPNQFP